MWTRGGEPSCLRGCVYLLCDAGAAAGALCSGHCGVVLGVFQTPVVLHDTMPLCDTNGIVPYASSSLVVTQH